MASVNDNIHKQAAPSATAAVPPGSPNGPLHAQASPSEDDLPESLRTGGAAELAIERAERARTTGDDPQLIDSFRNELQHIRTEYEDVLASNEVPPTKRKSAYSLALTAYQDIYNADHVFRFCLADLEKIQNAREDLWNPAAAKYREKSDAYDRLLGDFIPRILRDRIRSELASNAYTGGSNASASDDWDMYRIRLRERRQKNMPALSTGIPALDRLIGGLPKLAVLAGVAGAGKTALALSMTVGALHAHPDVAAVFYSLDMAKDVIYDRLLCHQSGLNYREVLRNYEDPGVTCQLSEAEAKLAVAILPRLRVVERGQPIVQQLRPSFRFRGHRLGSLESGEPHPGIHLAWRRVGL